MELIRPQERLLASYAEAIKEDELHRPHRISSFTQPSEVFQTSYNREHGIHLNPGRVRSTTLWLVEEDKFIGEVRIRHELVPLLLRHGGHIGYSIHHSEEAKGYGTKMLAMALEFCRTEMQFTRVLITCNDTNIGSIRVIEKNGGILENKVVNNLDTGKVLTRRYWIDL